MPDMLVRLYNFDCDNTLLRDLEEKGITVRRAMGFERHKVLAFAATFNDYWVSECAVAFSHTPATCFIAIKDKEIVGFACFDTTCKDFFGPTGVSESMRGMKLGKALLHIALDDMKHAGYGYAVIGDPGPIAFYEKNCGATIIDNSEPGIYKGML